MDDNDDVDFPQEQQKNRGLPEHLKAHQFQPGKSGNPGGRPKGSISLKEYAKRMLLEMDDEEKKDFMRGLDKDKIWEMGEGKAKQDNDHEVKGTITIEIVNFANENKDSSQLPTT